MFVLRQKNYWQTNVLSCILKYPLRRNNWIWCPRRGIVRHKSAITPVISFEKTVTRHRNFLYCLGWSWADTNSMVFWINSKPLCMSIWFEARAKRSRRRLVLIHNGFLFFLGLLSRNMNAIYNLSCTLKIEYPLPNVDTTPRPLKWASENDL